MSHYRIKPYKLRNKPEVQWADYLEDGEYYVEELVLVPIEKIKFNKWNQSRYDFYIEAFKKGQAADPVRIGRPWGGGDYYEVGDGNHRVAASLDMGYTHVPAIVTRMVKGVPEGSPPRKLYEEVFGRELLRLVEFFRAQRPSGSKLYFEWGGVVPHGYWLKVSDESESAWQPYEERFEVIVDGDIRRVEFRCRGKRMAYRGDLEGMKREFLRFMGSSQQAKTEEGIERVALKVVAAYLARI